ncbi:MAG: SpoIID/LytB domain-containing protein [Pyrinomonadaceae bacterium MAG19_C2-C3]|nr:SpoIID/LytB domain-containing protein [Pyrinomonadaceae bacterium MAG19_C2-C3]
MRRLTVYSLALGMAIVVFVLLGFAFNEREYDGNAHQSQSTLEASEHKSNSITAANSDLLLQRAANDALGEREGSIIVMDAQVGRVRAIVNPRLAAEHAFPPGSAIKPFTLLAALRTGVVAPNFTHLCQHVFRQGEYQIACSHPKSDAAFDLKQALAYSCNDCFARIGERTNESSWTRTVKEFGFGERTGSNVGGESAGRFRVRNWSTRTVLGEDDAMLVTPLQMASAYAALINGGRLMDAKVSDAKDFHPVERNRVEIDDAMRDTLIGGMRGAVKYGTAREAKLDELPITVFGKTGTSTASNNFRTQGWFIGFAGDDARRNVRGDSYPPEKVGVVVLVFLRRAHGADAAHVAHTVFEEYARTLSIETPNIETPGNETSSGEAGRIIVNDNRVRVADDEIKIGMRDKAARRNFKVASMKLDDYVAGVLAAESSIETEGEALKGQAVTSRTFALANKGRHAPDGFDFCTTTHCQRFIMKDAANDGRAKESGGRMFRRMREVAGETSRQVLIDANGKLVNAYFHAACGGATANINRVWGTAASSVDYLNGSKDDACSASDEWTTRISSSDAGRVMRANVETNVGVKVLGIEVVGRDASGRVEWLEVRGKERTVRVRGWDFKIAIGRALGWANLKSTLFEVEREGNAFVFRGTGFGHGLGLCQAGAHTRAAGGATSQAILKHYYPHTNIVTLERNTRLVDTSDAKHRAQISTTIIVNASINAGFQTSKHQLSSEHFRVMYDDARHTRDAAQALKTLEAAYADLGARFAGIGMRIDERRRFDVMVYRTTGDFTARTGHAAWVGALTIDGAIHVQPFDVLRRRGTLNHTLRHETLHALTARFGARPSRLLAEGVAIIFAGEERFYRGVERPKLDLVELEQALARPQKQSVMRSLYAAAMDAARRRLREDEASVWRELAGR